MKYICIVILIFIAASSAVCSAAEESSGSSSSPSSLFNNAFSGQKQVTDEEFKKTAEQMKERSLTSRQKKIKKQVQPHSPAYDEEHLKRFAEYENAADGLDNSKTIMLPAAAYDENGRYIQPGYYKLSCRKIAENKYVLDLSQGVSRIITLPAEETRQNLEQDTIQFCAAEVLPDGRIRLMYGSLDLNLAAYLYYK